MKYKFNFRMNFYFITIKPLKQMRKTVKFCMLVAIVMAAVLQSCSKEKIVLKSRGTMDPDGQQLQGTSNPGGAGWQMDPNGGG